MKHTQQLRSFLGCCGITLVAIAWSTISLARSSEITTQRVGSTCGKWTFVEGADGPSSNSQLNGVSASAASNVWAVGVKRSYRMYGCFLLVASNAMDD